MARGRPSKKQHILDIAEQLFSKFGYQSTSIDLVVRESGVSKPTVYNNFPSKQALLQTLIHRQIELSAAHQSKIKSDEADSYDKIYTIFYHLVNSPFALALLRIFYGEVQKLDTDNLALCQLFAQQFEQSCEEILTDIIDHQPTRLVIVAIYKNGILNKALSGLTQLSAEELQQQIKVLRV